MTIPSTHIATNVIRSLGLITFPNIIIDGKLNVVTAIIKLRTVPSVAPFDKKASAIGMAPKISAYIGAPTIVANNTPKGLLLPRIFSIQTSGIQLWMMAPIATPTRIYGNTF